MSALAWVLGGALLWRGGASVSATRDVGAKANSVALVNTALGGGGLGGGGSMWTCEAGAGRGGGVTARNPTRVRKLCAPAALVRVRCVGRDGGGGAYVLACPGRRSYGTSL